MESVQLIADINGTAYPFTVREITPDGDAKRKFEVKDLFTYIIIHKGDNGEWEQDGTVALYPENLQSVGQAIANYYQA